MASPNKNTVNFMEDVEIGKVGKADSASCGTGGSGSRELSIVGPLPSETIEECAPKRRRSDTSSQASVNSYSINAAGNISKKFGLPGASILKKRTPSLGGTKSVTSKTGVTGSVRTSSTGGSSASAQFQPHKGTPRHVWYSRWLFLTLLCMVASVLGYLTYTALTDNETYLAECVFDKVAEHAIESISTNQKNKKLGMDSLGSVIGEFQCFFLSIRV